VLAPCYVIETVPSEIGTAFDVTHCPVASYFRERNAADLCIASWCNLDFALSELTHQKLVRTKTLVTFPEAATSQVDRRSRNACR